MSPAIRIEEAIEAIEAIGGGGWTLSREFLQVDPADLHLPSGRVQGADPAKLARQIARFGRSTVGMPPLELTRGSGGRYQINDGVTRATRVAKLLPGQEVPAEVIETRRNHDLSRFPTIKDALP